MSLMMGVGVLWTWFGNVAASTADAAESESTGSDAVITLERTACFGTCPIYTVTLHGDGRVDWNGEKFVAKIGPASKRIDADAVAALLQEIERAGFWQWPDRWECAAIATDSPSAYITVKTATRTRRIEHYHGNTCVPEAVSELEQRIDDVAGTAEWVGPRE